MVKWWQAFVSFVHQSISSIVSSTFEMISITNTIMQSAVYSLCVCVSDHIVFHSSPTVCHHGQDFRGTRELQSLCSCEEGHCEESCRSSRERGDWGAVSVTVCPHHPAHPAWRRCLPEADWPAGFGSICTLPPPRVWAFLQQRFRPWSSSAGLRTARPQRPSHHRLHSLLLAAAHQLPLSAGDLQCDPGGSFKDGVWTAGACSLRSPQHFIVGLCAVHPKRQIRCFVLPATGEDDQLFPLLCQPRAGTERVRRSGDQSQHTSAEYLESRSSHIAPLTAGSLCHYLFHR